MLKLIDVDNVFLLEYFRIGIFIGISILITCILLTVCYLVSTKNVYSEKLTPYECGYEATDSTKKPFEVHYYIFGILFILFDLEIVMLLPGACFMFNLPFLAFIVILLFILIVILGFVYEWKCGVLTVSTNVKK